MMSALAKQTNQYENNDGCKSLRTAGSCSASTKLFIKLIDIRHFVFIRIVP